MISANDSARITSSARFTSITLFTLIASLAACTGETVTMGEDGAGVGPLPASSRCLESTTLAGDVSVHNQEQLDTLEGCQVIDGSLYVGAFEGASLRPLHALTAVRGMLQLDMAPSPGQANAETPMLESLDGLESLESAGSLFVRGLIADNVDPLRNLKRLTAGHLSIIGSANLKNLDGLAQLSGVNDLRLECPELEDIAPLALPDAMMGLNILSGKLTRLSPLGVALVSPGSFTVAHTELRNLDAFAGLAYASESVFIENNLLLENIDGLNELQATGNLTIWHNPLLTRLPTFPDLGSLGGLQIIFNDSLTEVPAFPFVIADVPSTSQPSLDQLSLLALSTSQAIISDNPALTSIGLPRSWLGGSALVVDNNPALTQLTLTQQLSYDYLSITNNPGLTSIDIGVLGTVDLLEVTNNPLLDTAVFDAVQTFEARLSENAETL